MANRKLPWFKAWVKDILADKELKLVPLAARGFWLYLMCLMHTSPRRGYLLQENGTPYSNEQLAAISGCSTEEAAHLYQSLLTSAVFSVSEDGFVYSRRMVRESRISEVRSQAGKKGGDFAQAKIKQALGQKSSKSVESVIRPPPLDGEEKLDTNFPSEGGVGGEILLEQNSSKIDLPMLARQAAMKSGRDTPRWANEWEMALADLVDAKFTLAELTVAVNQKQRVESPWDFKKRIEREKNGQTTAAGQGMGRDHRPGVSGEKLAAIRQKTVRIDSSAPSGPAKESAGAGG